uniref:ADP-ribose glycohydrolase MACROD2-like isoform X4 n=1 Tax=Myxine glutinosa TaxID=7769 RepID=UPI00358F09AC
MRLRSGRLNRTVVNPTNKLTENVKPRRHSMKKYRFLRVTSRYLKLTQLSMQPTLHFSEAAEVMSTRVPDTCTVMRDFRVPRVDGCIHRAAGSLLKDECRTLDGCPTGQAKMTCGYRLPARYVIHTVGPRVLSTDPTNEERSKLESCYNDSLSILLQENLRSVAFPCISTGVFGFPNEPAAEIALHSVRTWLEKHHEKVDRIILCLFLPVDEKIYKDLLPVYFPHPPKADDDVDSAEERREACSSDVEMESQDLQESEQPTDKEEPSPIDSESGPMSEKMMNGAEESQQDKTADAHQESSVDEIGGGEGGAKLKTDEK